MADAGRSFLDRYRMDGWQALVTGAAHGIGFAAAEALAQAGAEVCLTDIDAGAVEAAAKRLTAAGHRAAAAVLDVRDDQAARRVIGGIADRTGRFDILVNNAGVAARSPAESYDRAVWEQVVSVNLTGGFLMAQAAAQVMLPRGAGSIVNVSSIMGLVGNGLYPNPAYHATKGALVNLTRALAVEWAPHLRVNAVAPCFVATPLTQKLLADPAMKAQIIARTPMGRLARADEVADAILFLASPAAAMVTGHVLAVDGGWLAQ